MSTDSSTKKNPDGSSSTTTDQNKCVNGQCTTDSTTCTTPAGGGTASCSTTTTTQSIGTKCASNPGSNACAGGDGTGSSFTGDCASGFKPVGDDAVLNAMALEIYTQNCKINPKDSETTLAAGERVKTGDQTGSNPNNSSVSISGSNFDTSDAVGLGSSCPADLTTTVMGQTFTYLPYSRFCGNLAMLGNILLLVSFLVAARIVTKEGA